MFGKIGSALGVALWVGLRGTEAFAGTPPAPAAPVEAPKIAACTVLTPTYTIAGKNQKMGTMFATKVGDKQLLVTAHSNFGPSGGLAAQLTPAELQAKVSSVVARDALAAKTDCARSAFALSIPDAAPMGAGKDAAADIAAFEVSVASGLDRLQAVAPVPLAVLPLAEKAPVVGDPVWLLALLDDRDGGQWAAKVVEVSPGFLFYQYADGALNLTGTTGAAIVNKDGQVVGVNVGFGKMEDGSLIGSGAPLPAIKQRLTAAVAPKP